MSQNSPLARVKEEFGGKDKLVDKIVVLLGSGDEPKDELRKRLLGAANRKLIRLHQVATSLKQHGGHDKLAGAAAAGLGRAKDKDYIEKLSSYSAGRLLDIVRVSERKAKAPTTEKGVAKAEARAKATAGAKASAKAKSGKTAAARKARAGKAASAEKNA
jgi:hypothetical protein